MTKRQLSTEASESRKRQDVRASVDARDQCEDSSAMANTSSTDSAASAMNSPSVVSTQYPQSPAPNAGLDSSSSSMISWSKSPSPTPAQQPPTLAAKTSDMAQVEELEITGVITEIKREESYDGSVVMSNPQTPASAYQPSIVSALATRKQTGSFPAFPTGDVVITVDPDFSAQVFQLQLHSSVLTRCSPWLARTLTQNGPEDRFPLWYHLLLQNGAGSLPELVRQRTSGELPSIETQDDVKIKTEDDGAEEGLQKATEQNGLVVQQKKMSPTVKAYYDIFAFFYGTTLPVSNTNIRAALSQSEELVKVASTLECLHSIRTEINEVLCSFRSKLFLAIKDDPVRWINIAIATQSRMIYPECLAHLVGAHPLTPWPTRRTSLPTEMRQLIASKARELERLCYEANESLLMNTIMVGKAPVAPEDSQHHDTWTVVSIFRDTIATRLYKLDKESYDRVKGRGAFYRAIAKGGSAYLDYEEVRDLCEDMTHSRWKDLGSDLKLLKGHAAEIVQRLAQNELLIDPDLNGIGYLTCYKPQASDYPW